MREAEPNERTGVDAGWRLLFAFVAHRPGATQPECWSRDARRKLDSLVRLVEMIPGRSNRLAVYALKPFALARPVRINDGDPVFAKASGHGRPFPGAQILEIQIAH